jgi:hypothetical protein
MIDDSMIFLIFSISGDRKSPRIEESKIARPQVFFVPQNANFNGTNTDKR